MLVNSSVKKRRNLLFHTINYISILYKYFISVKLHTDTLMYLLMVYQYLLLFGLFKYNI